MAAMVYAEIELKRKVD
jgi:hypothetical protein